MSHFAKVDNGKVITIIKAEAEFFLPVSEGGSGFVDSSPGTWIQTSFNTKGNIHYDQDGTPDGGVALRGNYASIGGNYDFENDVFYDKQPFPSWVLNTNTWLWEPPVPLPAEAHENPVRWDEETKSWKSNTG